MCVYVGGFAVRLLFKVKLGEVRWDAGGDGAFKLRSGQSDLKTLRFRSWVMSFTSEI